jgi:hypothetical protein
MTTQNALQPLASGKFVLHVALWLVLTFVLWYFFNDWLIAPILWLAEPIMAWLVPHTFASLAQQGDLARVFASVGEVNGQIVSAKVAGHQLAFDFNTFILTYSIPFLGALIMATPLERHGRALLWGFLALLPFILWSVVFVSLKQLMVGLGAYFTQAEGLASWMREGIALGFQLSTIIIPTIVPVIIWAVLARKQIGILLKSVQK